jgi:Flp pilus assembly protein TadG
MISRAFARLRRVMTDFAGGTRGNVTVVFALATVPIVGSVGAAVDYSHVNSARTAMQAAVDATALKLSKEATALTSAQLDSKAKAYFTALYTRPEVINVTIDSTYTSSDGEQLLVKANGQVKMTFTNLLGITKVNIGASSTVRWGNIKLRVALVLDNTGSMADFDKIGALKTASKNLLTQLKTAATNDGDVYVSIIPFAKDVNLNASNYKATWIDWTEWELGNGTCTDSSGNTEGSYTSQNSCEGHGKKWTKGKHKTWNGCVTDRGGLVAPSPLNTDTNVTAPVPKVPDTLFPAEQYSQCPQPIMPLSYDWQGMTNLIQAMSPAGNTNQAIGLAVGWMSLVGGGPFPAPPAMDPRYKYQQVIILLTDGLNTEDRWYSDANSIDARQKMTCDNLKKAGITLYTVQVNTGGDPTSTLLQQCASDANKFFLLTSANQMVDTFRKIGTDLSMLRLSK